MAYWRSHARDGVDDVVGCLAGGRVGECAVIFKQRSDGVKQGFLSLIVLCAELRGSLEHQMLQVMCQACGLGGVVFRTGTHGDVGLDAWLFLVDSHRHRQSVLQLVGLDVHGVARRGLIVVAVVTAASCQQNGAAYEHCAGKDFSNAFVHKIYLKMLLDNHGFQKGFVENFASHFVD